MEDDGINKLDRINNEEILDIVGENRTLMKVIKKRQENDSTCHVK